MTKFGQAEIMDYFMKQFIQEHSAWFSEDQVDVINMRNTQDAYNYPSSKDAAQGEIEMLGFIIGLIIGGTVGVFAMALCITAGQADKRENCTDSDK